jgi:hypothetical protein
LVLAHGDDGALEPWAAQALIERGAPTQKVDHDVALRLWAGDSMDLPGASDCLVATTEGAPLGVLAGSGETRRLRLPSRLYRSGLR